MGKLLEPSQNIERSIMKKYRKELWNPFIKAVKNYELVQENDKIAVCISGGKDSMLMAKLMQLLQRYGDVPFELTFLVMDPGYNEKNRKKIEENARYLMFQLRFLKRIFLMLQIVWISHHVIYAQECAVVICTARLRNLDAIKLR